MAARASARPNLVVVVGNRIPEESHHPVSEKLRNATLAGYYRVPAHRLIAPEELDQVLWVEPLRKPDRVD